MTSILYALLTTLSALALADHGHKGLAHGVAGFGYSLSASTVVGPKAGWVVGVSLGVVKERVDENRGFEFDRGDAAATAVGATAAYLLFKED